MNTRSAEAIKADLKTLLDAIGDKQATKEQAEKHHQLGLELEAIEAAARARAGEKQLCADIRGKKLVPFRVTAKGFKHDQTHGMEDVPPGTIVALTEGQAHSGVKQKLGEIVAE